MGVPFLASYSTIGTKTACIVDWAVVPFNVSVGVVLVSGTATFGVQYTLDDVNNAAVTPRWIADATLPAGTSSTGFSAYQSPVQAIRMNIQSIGGVLEFKVVQGLPYY